MPLPIEPMTLEEGIAAEQRGEGFLKCHNGVFFWTPKLCIICAGRLPCKYNHSQRTADQQRLDALTRKDGER